MNNKKYQALQNTTDWIINSSSDEFLSTFNMLNDEYSGLTIGEFIDSYIDDKYNNIEYNIITTTNFIFGAEEISSLKEKEPTIVLKESGKVSVENVRSIDLPNGFTDSYNAANDEIYDYSFAA
ncbi:hypothetical protein Q7381_04185 [Glaesserella parasuis]|nr:hypothetical protein [Glaesserella parasuis]MDP0119572.1 hypothetical protein [Glaesserella parasuis]